MKRVLNSGSIKLLHVEGREQVLINRMESTIPHASKDECIKQIVENNEHKLRDITFKFEIKAPFLILNNIHKTNLGYMEIFDHTGYSDTYVPPLFYKTDSASAFSPKECNELNTKFSNYYRNVINFYNKLVEGGLSETQAQLVLPMGLFSSFIWIVNAQDLIKFIQLNKHLSPEMYGYSENFLFFMSEQMPLMTAWFQKNQPIL